MNARLQRFINLADGSGLVVEFGAGKFDKIASVKACKQRIGIEICEGYARDFGIGAEVKSCGTLEVVEGDMREYRTLLNGQMAVSHRVAMFIDSLEHIEKADGLTLLDQCQEDFDSILIFAPVGVVPQEEDAWGYDNEWQRHRASWWPRDLEALGFDVAVDTELHGMICDAMFAKWRAA